MRNVYDSAPLIQKFKDSRMTFQEIAEKAGFSKPTAFRVLGRGDTPKIEHLLAICDVLEISSRQLFRRVEE